MRSAAGCFACAAAVASEVRDAATSSVRVVRKVFIVTGCSLGGSRDVGVDEAHGHRPVTNGRRAALHRTTTNIACGEHSRKARLEKKWGTTRRPPAVGLRDLGRDGRSGDDE